MSARDKDVRRLVTGDTSHQIYVVEDGERRWVPDLWTMHDHGLSPAELETISDDVLDAIPEGAELASTVPVPTFPEGKVVESENGAWEMRNGKLEPVYEPSSFAVSRGLVRDPETGVARTTAVYLPMSLLRAALSSTESKEVTS
ncbi:hypothetical protein ACWGE0_11875 [Lentzea sp. NPDC054927]